MKKYNKPVVEINGFEVEDVITVSSLFTGYGEQQKELQAVYLNLTGRTTAGDDKIGVYEW